MSRLPQLRASFMDAAKRQTGAGARIAHGRRGPLRMAVTVALALLLLAAGAVAATDILRTGSPVRPSQPLAPTVGLGVPSRGGSRVLGITFADPAGGPPWSMRLTHTTRDLLCIQIGRLHDGSFGVLGLGGAFHDDGEFHSLPPDAIGDQRGATSCQPQGVSVSLEVSGIPESGLMPEEGDLGVISRDRWVSYGLLGPDAVSVTYSYDGTIHTVPVESGTGAYVIVLPGVKPGSRPSNGITSGGSSGARRPGGSPLPNPAGALTAITYRFGGSTCEDTVEASAPHHCPRPEAKPARGRVPRSLFLNRPVLVLLHPAHVPGGYSAALRFTAPYTVPNALSGYSIASPSPCHLGTNVDPIDRDITAHATVTVPLEAVFANACGPTMVLEVLYSGQAATPFPGPGTVVVARTTIRRPG